MTDKTDIIESLNDLIRTSEDGAKGFLAAAERADDPSLKKLLQDRSESCAHAARELQRPSATAAERRRNPAAPPAPRIADG